MDAVQGCARSPAGHRRFSVVRKIRPGSQVPDGLLYAGGVPGGRPVQEGDPCRRTELPSSNPGRREPSGIAGTGDKPCKSS